MNRDQKFRQAAIVYLHVAILYEAAAYVMWRQGLLPDARGPAWLWLIAGAAVGAFLAFSLWRWHRTWIALSIWCLHSLRLPAVISGAFLDSGTAVMPAAFYLTALVVIVVNLGFLARAAFDL